MFSIEKFEKSLQVPPEEVPIQILGWLSLSEFREALQDPQVLERVYTEVVDKKMEKISPEQAEAEIFYYLYLKFNSSPWHLLRTDQILELHPEFEGKYWHQILEDLSRTPIPTPALSLMEINNSMTFKELVETAIGHGIDLRLLPLNLTKGELLGLLEIYLRIPFQPVRMKVKIQVLNESDLRQRGFSTSFADQVQEAYAGRILKSADAEIQQLARYPAFGFPEDYLRVREELKKMTFGMEWTLFLRELPSNLFELTRGYSRE